MPPSPPDRAVSPAVGDTKDGGTRGSGSTASGPASARPMPPAAGEHLPIVLLPAMPSASEVGLALAQHRQCLESCCFGFFFFNGVGFSFCLSKAGNKACAIMVFVSVSALQPQQRLLKFGGGYTSERYIRFCTFHESK